MAKPYKGFEDFEGFEGFEDFEDFEDFEGNNFIEHTHKVTPVMYTPSQNDFKAAVLHTHKYIKYAMAEMKTLDGIFALRNKIQSHMQDPLVIPKSPDKKITGVPFTDILSNPNYTQITYEILLVSNVDKLLLLLDDMCGKINNPGIYTSYIKILNGWLTVIEKEIEKRQQPLSKKQRTAKGGKSRRRRHRTTKRRSHRRRKHISSAP